jgi:uncharacterized alpha-E superfamily protein
VLIERVSQTARMLDVHHHAFSSERLDADRASAGDTHEIVDTALWLSLLRALSGSEAFLKRAGGRVGAGDVARFLLAETQFPRSIAYCVHSAHERLCDIRPPDRHDLPGGVSLERLRVLDRWVTARAGEPIGALHELLTHVVDEVHAICGTLASELLGG